MNTIVNYALNKVQEKIEESCEGGNVGTSERILSVIAGGFILGLGAKRLLKNPITAITGITLGGGLVMRGLTGNCPVKKSIDEMARDNEQVTVIEHRYFVK